eukprot:558749_1
MPDLAASGLFVYLAHCTRFGCSLSIAKLMHLVHRKQDPDFIPTGSSALSTILPDPFILLLDSDGPDAFMDRMNSDEAVKGPQLVWSADMRRTMLDQISKTIDQVRLRLAAD